MRNLETKERLNCHHVKALHEREVVYLNYVTEINAFWDWRESNPMSPSAIALWFALMDTANKAGWPRDFSVAISTLRSKMGAGKDAVYEARNQLRQKGRIDFRERKGNQSTVYKLISFASEKPTQFGTNLFVSDNQTQMPTQTPTQVPTQTPTQTPNNNKLNETKLMIDDDVADAHACTENPTPFSLFAENFGREPTPAEKQQCTLWLATWDAELVEYAFFRACATDVKNLAYVGGILQEFRRRGIADMSGVAEDDLCRVKAGR